MTQRLATRCHRHWHQADGRASHYPTHCYASKSIYLFYVFFSSFFDVAWLDSMGTSRQFFSYQRIYKTGFKRDYLVLIYPGIAILIVQIQRIIETSQII